MEKGTVSKKVNEDFIPVVHLNGSNLEYTEIIIEKKYEYLISLIKKALKNNNLLLIEIQNTFSYIFTGEPKGYSYCFPHDYSEAFIDSADYPKIYSQEEYDSNLDVLTEAAKHFDYQATPVFQAVSGRNKINVLNDSEFEDWLIKSYQHKAKLVRLLTKFVSEWGKQEKN